MDSLSWHHRLESQMPQTEKAGISQGGEKPTACGPEGFQRGVGAAAEDNSMDGQSRGDVDRSGKTGEAISTGKHSSRPGKCKHWDSSVNWSLSCLIFFLLTLLPACHCFWKIAAGQSWCTLDTGENVLTDRYGIKHKVYISRTRDGSVWLRFSADPKSSIEWTFVDEAHVPNQLYILEPSVIEILEKIEYSNSWCVLTDLDLVIRATSGWHPSYLTIFDPQDRQSKTIVYRHNKDCNMSTNISLSTNKQGLSCEGNLKKNACGQRGLPTRGMQTSTIFLRSVNFDPEGLDHWQCSPSNELHTSYTLKGTYYNAYVKMSNCDVPFESRFLGQEAISRPLRDDDEFKDMVLIPDPLHGSLSPGYLSAWRYYVNVHSILHSVAFQVWRPFPSAGSSRVHEDRVNQSILPQEQRIASHAASPLLAPRTSVVSPSAPVLRSKYTLIYQQMFHPPDLHYSEFKLEKKNYIQVERGDVLGIYFPDGNPIAWSSVPCALYEQLPKYVRSPPPNMKVGQTFSFQTLYHVRPPNTVPVCRQYSFNAVFVNKSDAYVIEDWICPTRETSTWWSNSWLGSDRPTSSLPVSSLSHFSYDEQKIKQRTSQENVFFHYRNAFKNRSTVFDLTLVRILVATVLGLLLMMSIIGLLSFCKAVKYPQSA